MADYSYTVTLINSQIDTVKDFDRTEGAMYVLYAD